MIDQRFSPPHLNMWHATCLLFVGLKLSGQIDWHWLLVMSPMIIMVGLGIGWNIAVETSKQD